ncbi:diacylglycerol kinase family protein [Cytobacillus spongiae]|jgi:diacylglycerol kinase|uniref:diacylglycerol kinase family protein n=1 Tax=Cytobacillus spongiae TaxID=2901381 RepID=UPI001F2BD060|nr:diacylglycerol kinase family protein [Cytobacillus spongiae]UII54915.1 diacylglycerol kinase family protein [Cytobacillus spongiae]
MNSDYKGRRRHQPGGFLRSFSFAYEGIKTAIKNERNLQIHFIVSVLVIVFGIIYSISMTEWVFICMLIGGVISLELLNSAIERVVDLVTDEYHPLAKQAKDIAAGAVLIYAILSVIVGGIIFIPRIFF